MKLLKILSLSILLCAVNASYADLVNFIASVSNAFGNVDTDNINGLVSVLKSA